MPNHVTTKIYAPKNIIDEIITLDENGDKCFDFNTIIPMPDNIFRGDLGKEEEKYYGKENWYHWSIDNWETKWNSYSYKRESEDCFSFETAWSHPKKIISGLSKKYPEIEFTVLYANEDIGYNCGGYKILNGDDIASIDIDNGDALAKEFAWKLRGSDELYYSILEDDIMENLYRIEKDSNDIELVEELKEENSRNQERIEEVLDEIKYVKSKYPEFNIKDPLDYFNI